MAALIEYLLIAVAAMFVIVNPLTTAFLFASMTTGNTDPERKEIARRAVVTSTSVLVAFALLGSLIFQIFGITLAAFRIAGGLILFGIGAGMLQKSVSSDRDDSGVREDRDDIAIIPLAIPFISGPGAIATTMILTSEAPSRWHLISVFAAIFLSTGSCYVAMLHSKHLIRVLGETGRKVMTKIFGLILAVLAVQFVINGVTDAVNNFLAARGSLIP